MYEPEKLKKRYSKISNSALGNILISSKYFKKYIDRELDEDTPPYMELGTKLHMFLLEPTEFSKNYIYLDVTKPRGEKQQAFCEYISNSSLKDEKLKIKTAYELNYSTKGKSEQKLEEESTLLYDNLKEYIDYLKKTKEYKDILNWSTFSFLREAKAEAKKHIAASELLFTEDSFIDNPNVFEKNEFRIYWEYSKILFNNEPIVLKSIIDRLYIDHDQKVIKLIDLKTSSHLYDFHESYKTFKYYRQMAFYWKGIEYFFTKHFEDKNINEYTRETYIIGIQTPDNRWKDLPTECKVFPIDNNDLEEGNKEIDDLLLQIQWHTDNNKWEHSRSYYENKGLEPILKL